MNSKHYKSIKLVINYMSTEKRPIGALLRT